MTLTEYCDALNIEIEVKYYPNQGNRWCAYFKDCETKSGSILTSSYGDAPTPSGAINNYLDEIKGKLLVFNVGTPKRMELYFPATIEKYKD